MQNINMANETANNLVIENLKTYLLNFQHLPYGVAIIKNDAAATLVKANDAFYKAIGHTKEEFLNHHNNSMSDILVDDFINIVQTNTTDEDYDKVWNFRIRTASGEIRLIYDMAHYNATLNEFYVTFIDITDKMITSTTDLSYDAFLTKHEVLLYLSQYTSKYIVVADLETDKVVYLSADVMALYGFKQESDWHGKTYKEIGFGSDEDNVRLSFYEPLHEDRFTTSEYFNKHHNLYSKVESKIITIPALNRKMRLSIITDITAQKQLEQRIALLNTLHNCIENLFTTTTHNDVSDTVYYDVLTQLSEYYGADGAFFYKFVNGTNKIEKIYRIFENKIQPNKLLMPMTVSNEQVALLQAVSAMTVEESKNAPQEYGELLSQSFEQFNVDYAVKQFSCVTVNNNQDKLMAFMGVINPHINDETKELMTLLSRFVCMFLEHQQDEKIKEEAIILEEMSKSNIVKKCANNFQKFGHIKENIVDALDAVSSHYDADFAMIVYGNKNEETYGIPYIAGHSIPDLSTCQNQPSYTLEKWAERFKKHSQILTDAQLEAPVVKDILKKQYGIYNFIVSPLQAADGTLQGMLFVNNIKLKNRSRLLVNVVAKNISDYLEKAKMDNGTQLEATRRLENKVIAQNRVSALLEKEEAGTLFVINIDNFRQLNEAMGYRVGDQALVELFDNLQQIFKSTDVIGRIGGDEFMVFTSGFVSMDFVEKQASQILNKCHHYYNKDGISVEISVSIGICSVEDRCKTFKPLYENADYALHVAKKSGKNRYHIYSNAEYMSDASVAEDLRFYPSVIEKLKAAIRENSFVVHYQPIYHVPTGTFTQAEALVRMEKSDGTLIYPNDFIQIAESSGLVVEMTYQVLEQVCRDFRKLLTTQADTTLKAIAINVPYLQFADPNMEDRFLEILSRYHIEPSQIKLEITERSLITDMNLILKKMASLIEKGFEFELDDFGTDYSNLKMCITLPLEVIKLDRSLLLSAFESNKSRRFFEHFMDGIHDTEGKIVLEGVETQEQLDWARGCKCDYIQGYYFSKPVDFDGFAKFLLK